MSPLRVVFLNGKNTAGKDRQAELLAEGNRDFGILPLGNVLREAAKGGKHAEKVAPHAAELKRGILLPDEVTAQIVFAETHSLHENGHNGVVVPGFPRTERQLDEVHMWTGKLHESGIAVVTHHVALEVADPTVVQRAKKRRRKALDRGHEPRTDDDPEIVVRRLEQYREMTDPMLGSLTDDGLLHVVDADNQTNEEVHLEITTKLGIPTTYSNSRERR